MFLLYGLFYVARHVRRKRAKAERLFRLKDEESGISYADNGAISWQDDCIKQREHGGIIPDEAEPLRKKYLRVVDEGLGKKDVSMLPQKKVCSIVNSMLSLILNTS